MNTFPTGLIEFTRRLFAAGGLSVRGVLLLPVYYFQLIATIPFSLMQNLIFGRRINRSEIKDPVFILGHYRSGTTYLQKLLGSNPGFGYLTNYDALFVNTNLLLGNRMKIIFQWIIKRFRIKNPFFNTIAANLDDPAEEDDYLMNKASAYSAYWGFVFPEKSDEWLSDRKRFSDPDFLTGWKNEYVQTLKYATFKNPDRRLILKNPPSTARIDILLKLFPFAKFVYISRNPYEVYYSTRNMWLKAILPFYSLQKISSLKLDNIIFNHYNYLMEEYEKQKILIPHGNLVEITYEQLISDPFTEIKRIYTQLGIEGFDASSENLNNIIQREESYRNNIYTYTADKIQLIRKHWGKYTGP